MCYAFPALGMVALLLRFPCSQFLLLDPFHFQLGWCHRLRLNTPRKAFICQNDLLLVQHVLSYYLQYKKHT